MKSTINVLILALAIIAFGSCGTSRNAVKTGQQQQSTASNAQQRQLAFVQKVNDQAPYQKNVVAKLTLTVNTGKKNISAPAQLHMRKDDVIRLQLLMPILGTELGRLEFTKDYVLIVDRYHKQYVKGDYKQVDFLRQNGITFNSLQALFWNRLSVPGSETVSESELRKFKAEVDNGNNSVPISISQGKIKYQWTANRANYLISEAKISYTGSKGEKSELDWKYSNFKTFGSKKFPYNQQFSISSDVLRHKQAVGVTFEMSSVKNDDNWEPRTQLSDRYKEVSVSEVLEKLMSF